MNSPTLESPVVTGFGPEAFERFIETRDEPGWVTDLRREAFDAYQQKLAAPLDPEEWKRVDLRTLRPSNFSIQTESGSSEFRTLLADRAEFGGNVIQVDGQNQASQLDANLAAKGVIFCDLATAVKDHPELIQKYFMTTAIEPHKDRFTAWHAAFWTGGSVLYIPRGVEVEQPLHSLIGLSQANAADFSHTLVIVEDGASVTLLEETASATEDNPGLHVGAVELLLGKGSRLRYVQLQNWNQKTNHFAHQMGRVGSDSALQWTVGGLGSRLSHIHQDVMLDGRGAHGEVNGITFATDRQVVSYYTQQSHNAPNTTSDLLYKQVLRDRARVIWRGMIKVEAEAQQTDGYQRSDALILSDTCRNDSIPGLEIEADDVRCTHGATAGRVDEEQVFYCMSRGISRYEAMHMIVDGFFQLVYDRIPVEVVRETLSQAVERKLGIGD